MRTFYSRRWLPPIGLAGLAGAIWMGLSSGLFQPAGLFARSGNARGDSEAWLLTAKCSVTLTRQGSRSNPFESGKYDYREVKSLEIALSNVEAVGDEHYLDVHFDTTNPQSVGGSYTRSENAYKEEPYKWRRQTTSASGQVDSHGSRITVILVDYPELTVSARYLISTIDHDSWHDETQIPAKQGTTTSTSARTPIYLMERIQALQDALR